MKKILFTLALTAGVFVYAPAYALSCAPYSPVAAQQEFETYDVLAAARVVSDTDVGADAQNAVMYAQPLTFYKGKTSQPIVKIVYNADQQTFGFVRAKGTEVIIAKLTGADNFTVTGPCSFMPTYVQPTPQTEGSLNE